MRILLSTTSYQDTPGPHHDYLASSGFEIIRARGPLTEAQMLDLLAKHNGFDGLLNGDDIITQKVIDAALPKLRVIAKYGIGLDSINVDYATHKNLPVLFTPGVNHTTVAEHCFGLMIGISKHFSPHIASTREGGWMRKTGNELMGKTLGILGIGRISREVIKRAHAFGMPMIAYSRHWDDEFATRYNVQKAEDRETVLRESDLVSLHMPLTSETENFINAKSIGLMKKSAYLINTARGGIIDEDAVAAACKEGRIAGYAADVLCEEPMKENHPFIGIDNILLTPHIGSRTRESVERQAMRATRNLINYLTGNDDYIRAN